MFLPTYKENKRGRRFTLLENYHDTTPFIQEETFSRDGEKHLRINKTGITVFAGYSWDGASPKIFTKYGTPDFKETIAATLLHDVLYKYEHLTNQYDRKLADRIFFKLMSKNNFKFAELYYWFVRAFGWMFLSFKCKKGKVVR